MSNNIYDIMNKLNEVANKDMPVAKKESTDKTLLESTMKEVLNEKYMGFDKTVAAIKKGGSAKNPEAVAASIGREKYGKEKFQKAAAQGKKLGEGLARIDDPAYKDYYGDDLRPDTATIDEDDMEEGNLFTGNLAKARAAGKKHADLDGDGDMETVREGAKPDYIDLDKDGNRKESMKKAAADKKKEGVAEDKTQHVYLNPLGKHGKSPKKVATIKGKVTKQVLDKLAAKHNTDASNFEWGDDKWNSQFTKKDVSEGLENTDDILQGLTSAYRTCVQHRDSYTNFSNIQTVYELLRDPLMKGDIAEFEKMHNYVSSKYPDAFDALMDEVPGQQSVAEAAKWRADDLKGKTWRSPDWDDGDLSPSKIKIDRSGKDIDDSGDELTSRPGAWRGKADMAKRMTKKGVPTKSELAFQDNLKMRMRMKKKEGGLTGPKGVLPEQGVAEGYPYGQHKPKKGECPECGTVGGHEDDCSRHSDNKKQGVAKGSDHDDDYSTASFEKWKKQKEYEKEYDKKKPAKPIVPANNDKKKGVAEGKYDPAKDTFNPETHTVITKDGADKIIPKGQLAQYKEKGWKERHSLKAFHKNREKQGVAEGSDNSKWVVSYTEERKSYDEKPSSVTHEETMVAASSKEEAIAKVKKMSKVGTHMYGFSARPARKSDSDSNDIAEQRVSEETKETSTGRVHKAGPGGYGRKDDDDDDKKKDKKAQPAVKRGRGRPKKGADSETGEVKKWDTDTLQSWIVGSVPKKLPGKASVKHKIKDEPDEKLDEKAPPGAKAERMVKHIKKGYAKDGNLTDKEKGIAYATAWKAKKAGKVEESIPPGFPRSLAKKIYEHFDGNVDSTLNAMWNIHNTVMESQSSSKKKLSESMTFEQSTTAPAQKPVMGTYKGGVWTADPPKKGEVGVPVPQNIDGGSAPAPTKSKPVKTQKKAEVDTDTDLAEMLNLAGIKSQVDEADLSECGMSSSPISGGYGSDMHSTDGRMNISTNMSTDGNKSVTITADGDAAAELMQMLKIAGLNSDGISNVKDGVDLDHPGSVEIHGTMDSDGAEELAKKLRTAELDEAKDKRYHANTTPEEEVLPVQTQLKGGDGEVAGKEKKMKPHGYKFSDNPLSMKESMSLKLMKEYEGIKKAV